MNRNDALTEARTIFGDMGTISSDERLPRLVWQIGNPEKTMSRGDTWEQALANARNL